MQLLLGPGECDIGLIDIVDHHILIILVGKPLQAKTCLSQLADRRLRQRQERRNEVFGHGCTVVEYCQRVLVLKRRDVEPENFPSVSTLALDVPVDEGDEHAVILQAFGLVYGQHADSILAGRGRHSEFVAAGVPVIKELPHSAAAALCGEVVDTVLEGQQVRRLDGCALGHVNVTLDEMLNDVGERHEFCSAVGQEDIQIVGKRIHLLPVAKHAPLFRLLEALLQHQTWLLLLV